MEKDFNAWLLEKELRQLGLPMLMDQPTKEKRLGNEPLTLHFEMKYDQMGEKKTVLIELYLHQYHPLGFHVPAGYKATLKDQPSKSHVFPSSSPLRIQAKEAFNLLQGRAVNKPIWSAQTNRLANTWLQLGFTAQQQGSGSYLREVQMPDDIFPIGQMLREYPIHIQRQEELFEIMRSLYAGSIHRLEALDKDPQHVTYIEALPEKQQLQWYDAKGSPIEVIQRNHNRSRPLSQGKGGNEQPPPTKSKGRRL
jgi:hypothetical protein